MAKYVPPATKQTRTIRRAMEVPPENVVQQLLMDCSRIVSSNPQAVPSIERPYSSSTVP